MRRLDRQFGRRLASIPRWWILLLAGCAGRSGGEGDADAVEPAVAQAAQQTPQAGADDAAPAVAKKVEKVAKPEPSEPATDPSPSKPALPEGRLEAPENKLPRGYLGFSRACEVGTREVTIAAVGDVLIHRELQKQAFRSDNGFRALWAGVEDRISAADIAYANLEGPASWGIDRWGKERDDPGRKFDNKVYSGYARFNYHPSITDDLLASGFDVVSTANNHSLDRGPLGVDRTIDALVEAGLPYTGTRKQGDGKAPWHAVTQLGGMTIAWLACTKHTNWAEDTEGQVLNCFEDPKAVPRLVKTLAADENIDAVIVTPHWGKEYKHEPIDRQRRLAEASIEAGAVAVIGNHPHVIQPWEKVTTSDGREGLVMYSIGNFASHQRELPRRSSAIVYVGLTQGEDGSVWVNGARYLPITVRMEGDKDRFFVEPAARRKAPDVYGHVIGLMGAPNRVATNETEVRTNPECWAGWKPHRG